MRIQFTVLAATLVLFGNVCLADANSDLAEYSEIKEAERIAELAIDLEKRAFKVLAEIDLAKSGELFKFKFADSTNPSGDVEYHGLLVSDQTICKLVTQQSFVGPYGNVTQVAIDSLDCVSKN